MKRQIGIIIAVIFIGIIVSALIVYINTRPIENTYTPVLTKTKITGFQQYLPYSNDQFKVVWDSNLNQLTATIHQPYLENSKNLLNWMADHQMNDLPVSKLKIIRD